MSEIRANTVSNAAGTGPATLMGQSAAKVWCDWNQTGTQAIDASFNVSSITDNGAGRTVISYSSSFSSGNYAISGMCGTGGGNSGRIICIDATPLAGESQYTCSLGTSVGDMAVTNVMIMGDLA